MTLLSRTERTFLRAVSNLAYCNPFLPERIEHERQALGEGFADGEPVWSVQVNDPNKPRVNAWKISERVEPMVRDLRQRLDRHASRSQADLKLYEDAVLYLLFYRYADRFVEAAFPAEPASGRRWHFYGEFAREWQHYLTIPSAVLPTKQDTRHIFSCFFQLHRAFHHIFKHIVGSSMSAARLRAAVWQSIFTHDMRRYRRRFYDRMGDFATLITGPSGTGKELVARAIALSHYVPFDEKVTNFGSRPNDSFHPINLAALSPSLIESELFGHRRGAFTGAVKDRQGWLEICPALGAVFLDEIGELDPSIQVKLLRVIETRLFQPVGSTENRRFRGKLIAATHRNLAEAIRQERFREDFYYRLCSDLIVVPPLYEQLRESVDVLEELILFMAKRVAGEEAESLAQEAQTWIEENLGSGYGWPGNYRELEQCVRNVLVRRDYQPIRSEPRGIYETFLKDVSDGSLSGDALLSRYCTLVYWKTGSYAETARRLQLDRRTVKGKINPHFLAELQASVHDRPPYSTRS